MSTQTTVPAPTELPAPTARERLRARRVARGHRERRDDNPTMRLAITSERDRRIMYATLALLGVLWAFPMYAAVKKSLEVHGLQNYVSLFTAPVAGVSIPQTYLNSLIVGTIHAVIVVLVATTAGYAFSKLRWPGRDLAFSAALLFLAIPAAAMIVPFYSINKSTGLFNNFLGVGLPEAAITIPFGILLMRNYGRTVPDTLIEAARIDGASHLRVFRSIFLPLCRPPLINLVVLCYVWSMQDFMWPSIFLRNSSMTTAAQAVMTLNTGLGATPSDIARYNASLVLLAVPAILIAVFGMRFIIGGLTSGASKE